MNRKPTYMQIYWLQLLRGEGMYINSSGCLKSTGKPGTVLVPRRTLAALRDKGLIERHEFGASHYYMISADGLVALPDKPEDEADE